MVVETLQRWKLIFALNRPLCHSKLSLQPIGADVAWAALWRKKKTVDWKRSASEVTEKSILSCAVTTTQTWGLHRENSTIKGSNQTGGPHQSFSAALLLWLHSKEAVFENGGTSGRTNRSRPFESNFRPSRHDLPNFPTFDQTGCFWVLEKIQGVNLIAVMLLSKDIIYY